MNNARENWSCVYKTPPKTQHLSPPPKKKKKKHLLFSFQQDKKPKPKPKPLLFSFRQDKKQKQKPIQGGFVGGVNMATKD